jgi:predicted ATP-grasp superfamily ATP-dependent carboligase
MTKPGEHQSQSQASAVVLSFGGHADAYDLVRSLGMEGVVSIVASTHPQNIAFYSRFCARKVVLLDCEPENEPLIVEQMAQLSAGLGGKPVLFYASDPELAFVRRYQSILHSYYRFLLPRDETLVSLFNKALFSTFAREHDFPVPQTLVVKSIDELDAIISSIRFPCIVKPAYSQDWEWETEEQKARFGPYKKALRRFTSVEQLLTFCRALPHRTAGFLIQSYVDGRDEEITSFHGYFDEESRCLGYFVGRKIRTYPSHTGGSVYVQTIHNEELAQRSIKYLEKIGFQGIVKIDYKMDHTDNAFKMLEINPRYNLWQLLGGYAGVNLAAIAYRHQMGESVELRNTYRDDARLLFLKQDIRAYLSGYRKTEEWTLPSYLRSLIKRKYYRVFMATDPLPFIVSVIGFTHRNAVRLFTSMVAHPQVLRSRLSLTTRTRDSDSYSPMQHKDMMLSQRKEHSHGMHTHHS